MSFIAVALVVSACTTTVVPKRVQASQPSFDGTNQNSGVISFDTNTMTGVVTPNWRGRYNALIGIYASKFLPPITADYGLTPRNDSNYTATGEAFVDMAKMQIWKRNNIK